MTRNLAATLAGFLSVPFPTKVLSEHLRASATDREIATLLYSGSFIVTACFYNLVWQTAARGSRLIPREQKRPPRW